MKLFKCQNCGQAVFFENRHCVQCGCLLSYLQDVGVVAALTGPEMQPSGKGNTRNTVFRRMQGNKNLGSYRMCANRVDYDACNWAIPTGQNSSRCLSCSLNRTIPNLGEPSSMEKWKRLEVAKRRLVHTLLQLRLPLEPRGSANPTGLAFDFLGPLPGGPAIVTGHDNGLITINLNEADETYQSRERSQLDESYRTLLGHFRHEIGHYYWGRLVRNTPWLGKFRALFGDERNDYGAALKSHYANGAPPNWQSEFVTPYASSHPWEDWAETWEHYLHMFDLIDTARGFGLSLQPSDALGDSIDTLRTKPGKDMSFDRFVSEWVPLTVAINSFNRGMGLPDSYPFAPSPRAFDKLRFVHDLVRSRER